MQPKCEKRNLWPGFLDGARLGLASVFAAGLLTTAVALPAQAQEYKARMAYHWNPNHFGAVHAQKFADEVAKRSDNRIAIEMYPSGQLFGIREVMGAVTSGAVEMGGIVGVVAFPPINKNYNVANFPGLFADYGQKRAFLSETPEGNALWSDLERKTNSIRVMDLPLGPIMTFSSERELDGVEAMKGLKARRLFQIEGPLWSALEVDAISMPAREVYTSLQTGLIDTVNSTPSGVKGFSWWEFLKYAQMPYQSFADAHVMVNRTWYDNLPPELQKAVMEAGAYAGDQATSLIMSEADVIMSEFAENGGTITLLEGQAKAEFDTLMETKVIPQTAELIEPPVLAAARAYVAN